MIKYKLKDHASPRYKFIVQVTSTSEYFNPVFYKLKLKVMIGELKG